MKAGIRTGGALALALALVAVIALPASARSGGESGPAAKRAACDISGQQQDLGTSYVTSLKARNMGCKKAKNLVKAYHQCRHDNGGADGKCNGVSGYSCNEDRETAPSQFNAKAVCKKGGRKFVQTYTQNT